MTIRGALAESHGPLTLAPKMEAVTAGCKQLTAQIVSEYYTGAVSAVQRDDANGHSAGVAAL